MKSWMKCKVSEKNTILEAMQVIDQSALQVALVVNEIDQLLGIVTDGDIRRAILRNDPLSKSVSEIMNRYPITANEGEARNLILAKMQKNELNHIPVVNQQGHISDLISLKEFTYLEKRDNVVILMVGGLGTRLSPLTDQCPKPLLKVGNKPILETIMENFIEAGFYQFYLAVNYKAEMIQNYFGDGSQYGVKIRYIHEKKRMGTAGALSLLPEKMKLPIIVMNGDLLTKVNFAQMLDYHEEHKALATMAVREYNYQIPYGVIRFEESKIIDIQEKPSYSFFVNAGIYVINPEIIERVDKEKFFDMPDLFNEIIATGDITVAFPIREYWLDIGKRDDFEKAQSDFREMFE